MFEQLANYLNTRDYFGAGSILSSLASLFVATPNHNPDGFNGALVNIVPMKDCLHIFLSFDDKDDFLQLPGDLIELTDNKPVRMFSKGIHLGELWAPKYPRGVLLHFLYTEITAKGTINGTRETSNSRGAHRTVYRRGGVDHIGDGGTFEHVAAIHRGGNAGYGKLRQDRAAGPRFLPPENCDEKAA